MRMDAQQVYLAKNLISEVFRAHIDEMPGHNHATFAISLLGYLHRSGFKIVRAPAAGDTDMLPTPAAPAELAEADTWGLYARSAADLAESYGCRVEISRLDDPHCPLTDDADDRQIVVVMERETGRLVSMAEAWMDDDGEPLVPKSWLETVLSAWQAAAAPKRAAA